MTAGTKLALGILLSVAAMTPSMVSAEEMALFTKTSVKPEFREQYIKTVSSNLPETRKEDGMRKFDFYQDASSPEVFYQFAVWSGVNEAYLKQFYEKTAAGDQAENSEVIRLVPYRSVSTSKEPEGNLSETQNLIVVFEPKE